MNNENYDFHVPVLLQESIDGLIVDVDGVYVDATFGGGGHSRRILKVLSSNGRLFGFDQDDHVFQNLFEDERLFFCHSNFEYVDRFLTYYGVKQIDGLLLDLGVSSHHFDDKERGFSYSSEYSLDMRMNKSSTHKACDLLNSLELNQLELIFSKYGEVRNSKTLSKAVIVRREKTEFDSIAQFSEFLESLSIGNMRKYKAQVFQALRIAINNELDVLERLLLKCRHLIKKGGRLVVISYHSLEDRMVKNYIKSGNVLGHMSKNEYGIVEKPFEAIYPKLIVPSDREIRINSRAASAKMRIATKI